METLDVAYFIEHVPREFDVACAVKAIAEERWGLSVQVISLQDADMATRTLLPHVIALPFARFLEGDNILPSMAMITQRWQEATFLDLAFEQFLSRANQAYRAPQGDFVCNQVIHHAWGEFYKDYLIRHQVREDHIVINGNPSYGLYLEPYRHFYTSKQELAAQFGLAADARWIMFPENYGWVFLPSAYLEDYRANGMDPVVLNERRDFEVSSLEAVVHWWADMANTLPHEIILRPRPAIEVQPYREVVANILGHIPERFHIIKDGTIKEWLIASDYAFSSVSTTLLEATLLDKPAYMLEPYPFPAWLHCEWYDLVPHVRSQQELHAILSQPPAGAAPACETYVKTRTLSSGDPVAGLAKLLYDLRQQQPQHARYIERNIASPQRPTLESDRFTPQQVEAATQRWKQILSGEFDA